MDALRGNHVIDGLERLGAFGHCAKLPFQLAAPILQPQQSPAQGGHFLAGLRWRAVAKISATGPPLSAKNSAEVLHQASLVLSRPFPESDPPVLYPERPRAPPSSPLSRASRGVFPFLSSSEPSR